MSDTAHPWHVEQASYEHWLLTKEAPFRQQLKDCQGPLISIVLATYNTPHHWLRQALDSVVAQRYRNWQLCIADDASTDLEVQTILREYQQSDSRITVHYRDNNGGIAAAGNSAIALARGDYVAFMDHDDCLPDHALLCVARELLQHPDTGLLYSDADHLDTQGRRCRPFFKPGWNRELLLGQNYCNHLTVISSHRLRQLQGLREGYEGSQDYDLLLRAIESMADRHIRHIPQVLYHWREAPGSVSRSNIAAAAAAARRAVQDYLQRQELAGQVHPASGALIYNRVDWEAGDSAPAVAVLVTADDAPSHRAQVAAATDYGPCRFLEGPADPTLQQLLSWIDSAGLESFEFLCVYPARCLPAEQNWLRNLVGPALRNDIGCVGAAVSSGTDGDKLCPPPVLSPGLQREQYWGGDKGYYASSALDRETLLLDRAPLVLKMRQLRALSAAAGKLPDDLPLHASLPLACHRLGLRNIWTPSVKVRFPSGDCADQAFGELRSADLNYNANLAFCRSHQLATQS